MIERWMCDGRVLYQSPWSIWPPEPEPEPEYHSEICKFENDHSEFGCDCFLEVKSVGKIATPGE
eukprot:2336479-Karenia_brevis.AAC.1